MSFTPEQFRRLSHRFAVARVAVVSVSDSKSHCCEMASPMTKEGTHVESCKGILSKRQREDNGFPTLMTKRG
jgi:hypothetical protein